MGFMAAPDEMNSIQGRKGRVENGKLCGFVVYVLKGFHIWFCA